MIHQGGNVEYHGWRQISWVIYCLVMVNGCGEPMYENAGGQQSLLEVREACAMEIDQSPAATAYRQNPNAHADYPFQALDDMNRCIERKGWKQVRSQREQEELNRTVSSELARTEAAHSRMEFKTKEAVVRAIEGNAARTVSKSQDSSVPGSN